MAHEVESMAYANAVPWHGLGARVDDNLTPEEMLEAAGLNWRVNLHPLKAEVEGKLINIPGRFALIRDKDNKVMTVTGSSWTPVQNIEALNLMKNYVAAGGASLETAGSLRGGKVVWGLARLNHSFEVRPGDRVNGYLLINSSHEVGKATTVRTTTVRVVCANTLALAESAGGLRYRQNHLTEFDFERAKDAIAAAHEELGQAENRAKTIASLKLSIDDAMAKVFIPAFIPSISDQAEEAAKTYARDPSALPRQLTQLLNSYSSAPGAEEGTGWGALNAVTHWADHVAGSNPSTRLYRAWNGDTARLKTNVEKALYELAA